MENLLVLQSGGPTAVINASLAGVIKAGFDNSKKIGKVYGSINGIEGVENQTIVSLELFNNDENLRLLKQTPASYLGSCRKKLPALGEDDGLYCRIFEALEKYNIGYLCCIGGNDSMDTANKLSAYAKQTGKTIRVIGVPKTVDNDLVITDHTPGYGSAAKFIANCMRQIALDTDVYKMPSVVVLETMGRNAGWLAASAELANDSTLSAADIVCLPERPFDLDAFLAKVEEVSRIKKTVMIAVSEGIRDKDGNYIKENNPRGDKFGHAALGGAGKTVESRIAGQLGFKTRSIELSTLQRCFAMGTSLCDVTEAFEAGYKGVEFALEGHTGVMPGFRRISDNPYKMQIVPLNVCDIANFEKKVPEEMISQDGFGLTEKFREYALPLITGEPELVYKNGCLQFAPSVI
ncbi:MAG: 6-phosphofructokinase [Clostridia bacterium]|nr:6-phosphofructokinase [Clostridia bacterium]MBR6523979.1 6-phosphofructokinase [Clostridia bacterium]